MSVLLIQVLIIGLPNSLLYKTSLNCFSRIDSGVIRTTSTSPLLTFCFKMESFCSSPTNAAFTPSSHKRSTCSTIRPLSGEITRTMLLLCVNAEGSEGKMVAASKSSILLSKAAERNAKQKVLPQPVGAQTNTSWSVRAFS